MRMSSVRSEDQHLGWLVVGQLVFEYDIFSKNTPSCVILFVWSAKVRQLCDCVYLILLIFEPRLKGKFVSHFNFQSAFPSSEDVKSSWTYRSSGGPSCQTYGHGLVAGLWVFSALTDPKTIQDLRNGDGENFEAWGWPERAQSPEVRDIFSPKNKAKVKWVKWASRITGSIFRSSTSALALQFFFCFCFASKPWDERNSKIFLKIWFLRKYFPRNLKTTHPSLGGKEDSKIWQINANQT